MFETRQKFHGVNLTGFRLAVNNHQLNSAAQSKVADSSIEAGLCRHGSLSRLNNVAHYLQRNINLIISNVQMSDCAHRTGNRPDPNPLRQAPG